MNLQHIKLNCFILGFAVGVLSLGGLMLGVIWLKPSPVKTPFFCQTEVPDPTGNATHAFVGPCRIVDREE
jgi:hypothetical protein